MATLLEVKSAGSRFGTTVQLNFNWFGFAGDWNQGILGPRMLIGTGSGSWMGLGAARRISVYDGETNRQLLSLDGIGPSISTGQSGEGVYHGDATPALDAGVIEWRVLLVT
jgi:hypothetical protein